MLARAAKVVKPAKAVGFVSHADWSPQQPSFMSHAHVPTTETRTFLADLLESVDAKARADVEKMPEEFTHRLADHLDPEGDGAINLKELYHRLNLLFGSEPEPELTAAAPMIGRAHAQSSPPKFFPAHSTKFSDRI
jgi:hypothetical protein